MFDYKSIVSDDDLTTHFIPDANDPNKLNAFATNNLAGEPIGWILKQNATFEASDDNIFMQYKLWTTRPERRVGQKVDLEGMNMSELVAAYEELFIGAYIMQRQLKIASSGNPYEGTIDWLRTTDFYKAPASTRFHDAIPGGLLIHSLKVYNCIVDLLSFPTFEHVSLHEVVLVALMHDWCKIGFYEMYMKNVKDEATGTWNKEPAYRVNQTGIPLGHGVTSMYLASRVINLSVEQCLAIRWHMGRYNVSDKEENEFQKAVAEYPMVYMIQIADQLSCVEY